MKTLVTHDGTFHADDVFAVATFLLAHEGEDWQIVRSREKDVIEKADAVMDTGYVYDSSRLRFDHHQEGGAGMRDGIPYAAFGLLWKEYGENICGSCKSALIVESRLVLPTDAHDNGVSITNRIFQGISPYELSNMIQSFNPTWVEDENSTHAEKDRLDIFLDLVMFAKRVILREAKRARDKCLAEDFVLKAYTESEDKRIIILDKYYPYSDTLIKYTEPLFVIYPNPTTNIWCAKTVSKEDGGFESRLSFPKSWEGKEDEMLQNITGVKDAKFCHRAGFLCVAKSREGAIELAKLALG